MLTSIEVLSKLHITKFPFFFSIFTNILHYFIFLYKVQLPSPPVFIVATGLYDVDYRIVIACRNGNIYTIKSGELMGAVIELDSQPCGIFTS